MCSWKIQCFHTDIPACKLTHSLGSSLKAEIFFFALLAEGKDFQIQTEYDQCSEVCLNVEMPPTITPRYCPSDMELGTAAGKKCWGKKMIHKDRKGRNRRGLMGNRYLHLVINTMNKTKIIKWGTTHPCSLVKVFGSYNHIVCKYSPKGWYFPQTTTLKHTQM